MKIIGIRGFEKISYKQFSQDVEENFKLYQDIKIPQRATRKSSGYDFYAVYDFILKPEEEIKLPSGIKVYMLDDEELLLFPRSSVGFKYNVKLNNTVGKIDADYYNNKSNEGHIWLKFTNGGNKDWVVKKGDAIAQGTFYKYLVVDDDVPVNEKRQGGIGSTSK